jgi:membrane-anchored protein YejM (alkaline phosphatase superfamily)
MSTKSRQGPHKEETLHIGNGVGRGHWGAFAGLIVAVLIAYPLSACIAFATHPATQKLFGGRLEAASQAGYQAFWWILALLCLSLPFIVGFGIARLSTRTLTVIGAIVGVFLLLVLLLGQVFAF